jgi:hypothetical protein
MKEQQKKGRKEKKVPENAGAENHNSSGLEKERRRKEKQVDVCSYKRRVGRKQ